MVKTVSFQFWFLKKCIEVLTFLAYFSCLPIDYAIFQGNASVRRNLVQK